MQPQSSIQTRQPEMVPTSREQQTSTKTGSFAGRSARRLLNKTGSFGKGAMRTDRPISRSRLRTPSSLTRAAAAIAHKGGGDGANVDVELTVTMSPAPSRDAVESEGSIDWRSGRFKDVEMEAKFVEKQTRENILPMRMALWYLLLWFPLVLAQALSFCEEQERRHHLMPSRAVCNE